MAQAPFCPRPLGFMGEGVAWISHVAVYTGQTGPAQAHPAGPASLTSPSCGLRFFTLAGPHVLSSPVAVPWGKAACAARIAGAAGAAGGLRGLRGLPVLPVLPGLPVLPVLPVLPGSLFCFLSLCVSGFGFYTNGQVPS